MRWTLMALALTLAGCKGDRGEVMYSVICRSCVVEYTVNDSLRRDRVKNGLILFWHPLYEQECTIVVDSVDTAAPSQLAVSMNGERVHTQECDSGAVCVLGYNGEFTYK